MTKPGVQTSIDEPFMEMIERLYPICRSITGNGVRETLEIVGEKIPLVVHEVASGTPAFDWTVPPEWNIREAYIADSAGARIVDFRNHNLHVLNYSTPVDTTIDRDALDSHLHSLPKHPDWIPYRTSYYNENWGFCLSHKQREALSEDSYRVVIDSDLQPGSLTYGEYEIPGESGKEVLIYTHVCHPSLCNDNLTGIAVATHLAHYLSSQPGRRYTYRFVFGPGTIGSIVWLSRNQQRIDDVAHGLVVGLLGDAAPFTYKRSRGQVAEIDDVCAYVLGKDSNANRIVDFSPYGYDERQFGSPGINLPVGRLTRSSNGEYAEYHTSADNPGIVSEARLQESLAILRTIVDVLDNNYRYINQQPNCEPQLGRRGLFRKTGGTEIENRESAMLWLLNQSDGTNSVLDIARKSNLDFDVLVHVADELLRAKLLKINNYSKKVPS